MVSVQFWRAVKADEKQPSRSPFRACIYPAYSKGSSNQERARDERKKTKSEPWTYFITWIEAQDNGGRRAALDMELG